MFFFYHFSGFSLIVWLRFWYRKQSILISRLNVSLVSFKPNIETGINKSSFMEQESPFLAGVGKK